MNKRSSHLMILILVAAAAVWLLAGPAAAQSTPTPDQVDAVAKDLWCPLCNGVRLDNCELQACAQMREEIGQKLAAGQDKEQIKTYFVQRYGDVVLGMPSTQGFNLVAWIVPVLLGVLALGAVFYLVFVWARRRPAPVVGSAGSGGKPRGASSDDEYMQRVDDELNKYE